MRSIGRGLLGRRAVPVPAGALGRQRRDPTHVFGSVEEFRGVVGEHLGWSEPVRIEQRHIDQFAEFCGDRQWIHVDPEAALAGGLDGTVVHGFMTLALLNDLIGDIYRVDGLERGFTCGVERVRYPASLPVGSWIRVGAELLSTVDTVHGCQAVLHVVVRADGMDRPVCVADLVILHVPA